MAQKTESSPSAGWRVLEVEDAGPEIDRQVKVRVELPQPPSPFFEGESCHWGSNTRDEPRLDDALDDASWFRSRKGV